MDKVIKKSSLGLNTENIYSVNKKKTVFERMIQQKYLFLMLIPALLWVVTMCYMPMYGLYMAFINYIPDGTPFFASFFSSKFVGFQWIRFFIFESGDFWMVMRNTLAMSCLTIIFSLPAPIIIALSLNEIRQLHFKKIVQTVSYLPFFLSWVVVANIFLTMLSGGGVINEFIVKMGISEKPILFFQEGKYFWWIIAFANTWKSMGYNAIIYLAAISAIGIEMYEAATVDGANRVQQMWYITLPSIMPTVIIMLILSVGGLLNAGFEQQFLMQNNLILNHANVIDLYSYKAMQQSMFSYGAAVGLFKSIISFVLLVTVNGISKRAGSAHIM